MNQQPVIHTLADLVSINSVNPAYEGGQSEAVICEYIRRFFHTRGIETWQQEVFPGRPNLIARLAGQNPNRRIILEAHTDTVSVAGMTMTPFDPRITEGRLYGRGACDTKGGLAAMMHALTSLKADGLEPPCEVWLVAAADEEFSYRGVVKLCEDLKGAAAIVAEPTELRAVITSNGVVRWRILVRGRAAHSSKPHLGTNAITHMARIVLGLEADHERLSRSAHPLLGSATCNVGVIRGGVQVNFVPDSCAIEIDRRLLPGENVDAVLAAYQRMLDDIKAANPSLDATMEPPMLVDHPLETAPNSPPAQLASRLLREMGLDPQVAGVPFGSDASKLSHCGIPSIVFGPGSIDQAHASAEYVEVRQVLQAEEFYRNFILSFE